MNWRSFPESTESLETLDGGRSILAVAENNTTHQEALYKISLKNGAPQQILENDQRFLSERLWDPYCVSADGHRVVYVSETREGGPDFWLSDANFSAPRKLTDLNPKPDLKDE
jgi:hypothetical protein